MVVVVVIVVRTVHALTRGKISTIGHRVTIHFVVFKNSSKTKTCTIFSYRSSINLNRNIGPPIRTFLCNLEGINYGQAVIG